MVQNKRIWNVLEVDEVENEQLNIVIIVVEHHVVETVEDNTPWRPNVNPTIVERSIRSNVANNFIDDEDD